MFKIVRLDLYICPFDGVDVTKGTNIVIGQIICGIFSTDNFISSYRNYLRGSNVAYREQCKLNFAWWPVNC